MTLALLLVYEPCIVRSLRETLELLRDPRRYDEACQQRLESALRWCLDIPFYAQRFAAAGLFDGGHFHAHRFEHVEPLTKRDIRRHFGDLQHPVRQTGRYENTSGGSTGEPVRLVQDREFYARGVADTILFGMLNGKRPGEREVKLWGNERDILQGSVGLREHVINRLYNRVLLNSFAMDATTMRSYIDQINRIRPVQIWTYVDSIVELARFAAREGRSLHNPRTIICTAGTLYPEMREELEQAFPGARIVNQYGSREVGQIGCEVPGVAGVWLMRHSNHISLVDIESGTTIREPERPGKVLVTTLANRSMPLVRYDIGDIAEYASPGTAGPAEAFGKLHGRENSHFITSRGAHVHGEFFTHMFYGCQWVEKFQVVQRALDQVDVRYVARGRRPDPRDLSAIREAICRVMGPQTAVSFEECPSIDRLSSGKYQFVRREFA